MLGESLRRRQKTARSPRPPGGRRRWRPLLVALPLALLVPFALGYLLAVYVIFPPPPDVGGTGIGVPELVGRPSSEAQRELVAAGLGALEVTELPHPTAPAGQVIAQSPLPGQQLRAGAGVRVALSAGQPRVVVPDVYGYGAERAEVMLQRAGFAVQRAEQESAVPAGRVIRTEPEPAQVLPLPATITLVVSTGPPPAAMDTIPPDTLPGGR